MTSCDYCDAVDDGAGCWAKCDECEAMTCAAHHKHDPHGWGGDDVLCSPDPATWPGRGCYKPPVAEVKRASCMTREACLRADRCLGVCS